MTKVLRAEDCDGGGEKGQIYVTSFMNDLFLCTFKRNGIVSFKLEQGRFKLIGTF